MKFTTTGIALAAALTVIAGARAQDDDLAAGEKLYVAQCKLCHGSVVESEKADLAPASPQLRFVRLALQQTGSTTMADVPTRLFPEANGRAIAFAPPFGPNLRGVYGRAAGTMAYEYSSSFLNALKGMEWNDAALDVWITNPQAWVPGVFMFYKQPDAEIRRKIILYMKANP
jgi:cytochrome c2